MHALLVVAALFEGQQQITFSTLAYHTSSCSSSKGTGYVPFTATFTCTVNGTQAGCVAGTTFDLGYDDGTKRPYECSVVHGQPRLPVTSIAAELSGVEISASNSTLYTFGELRADVHVNAFNTGTQMVDWEFVANWKNTPVSMVDQFVVTVHGEFVWTTGVASSIVRSSNTCANGSGDNCLIPMNVAIPSGWRYGGVALSEVRMQYAPPPGTNTGMNPSLFYFDVSETPGTGVARLKAACQIGGASSVACRAGAVTLLGTNAEVEPTIMGPYEQVLSAPSYVNFLTTNVTFAAMRCGLKQFHAQEQGVVPNPDSLNAIWFGAKSLDCGWSPPGIYNGAGVYAWIFQNPMVKNFDESFTLDATRLH